ncbi:protein YebE [Azoarcus sp. DD4]|uniref:tellurite resistance TerB family protein n=1 Tax=Azoarcus sp. DD4 TaxID=2027405 RepID=UPI00112C5C05|nr:tellurite resistance TerB family protein [Azoarcus sp. DD4]QDF96062.1 protein YebE [Azoarcus sp. DD4]
MSFGDIVGRMLQQGMTSQSRTRLEHSMGPQGLGGVPGLGDLLGAVLGGQGAGRAGGGGLADILGGALGGQAPRASGAGLGDLLGSVLGGATPGGTGGLGDVLGSVLGGGRASQTGGSNPLGGAGMTILATIAMAALKNWTRSGNGALGLTAAAPEEMAALTAPETGQVVLQAMLCAAKADGAVDEAEIQRIVGEIDDDGVSPAEKEFLFAELRKPLDLQALVAAVPDQAVAAQVYGASLLAIDLDTEAEVAYLRQLSAALGLDSATVARLHALTGAPAI